jgi:uncharacterized C2H2 Zn-finger protein
MMATTTSKDPTMTNTSQPIQMKMRVSVSKDMSKTSTVRSYTRGAHQALVPGQKPRVKLHLTMRLRGITSHKRRDQRGSPDVHLDRDSCGLSWIHNHALGSISIPVQLPNRALTLSIRPAPPSPLKDAIATTQIPSSTFSSEQQWSCTLFNKEGFGSNGYHNAIKTEANAIKTETSLYDDAFAYTEHSGGRHQYETSPLLICTDCGKIFSTKSSLETRVNMPSVENPFHCPECTETFKWRRTPTTYKQNNLNQNTHGCWRCGMNFKQARHLYTHRLSHETQISALEPLPNIPY